MKVFVLQLFLGLCKGWQGEELLKLNRNIENDIYSYA